MEILKEEAKAILQVRAMLVRRAQSLLGLRETKALELFLLKLTEQLQVLWYQFLPVWL